MANDMNNEQTVLPVQRQLDAYNAKDLAAFISCYHSDIAIYRMPATEPSLKGRAALEAFYKTERFTIAALRAEVLLCANSRHFSSSPSRFSNGIFMQYVDKTTSALLDGATRISR